MSTVRRLRPWLVALVLVALVGGVPACGGGHHHHHDLGTLEVLNDCGSFYGIDTIEIEDSFANVLVDDVFLSPCEFALYDLEEDDYEVRIYWSDFSFDTFFISIFDGDYVQIDAVN